MPKQWQTYEDAARTVLTNLRKELGLAKVETKQTLSGKSGVAWEIDAKAWRENCENFLVVEARRHTTSALKQEHLAAIAYRIDDLGAHGGIVVSPLPLQRGARIIARSKNIDHLRLTSESTPELYLAEYMGKRYHGVTISDGLTFGASIVGGSLTGVKDDNS